MPADGLSWALVLGAALAAGFTSGFAGFGTGLVASGLWFHALPAGAVPPLVVLTSVAAQLVGIASVRRSFDWWRVRPFVAGGAVGVPLGVAALQAVSPAVLRASVGMFLLAYVLIQFSGAMRSAWVSRRGAAADSLVGVAGGFLGGFAGLSGPLPLVWLQLKGGAADAQRAIYQPFNLCALTLAAAVMAIGGRMNADVLVAAAACLPLTLLGAWLGVRSYRGVAERTFRLAVLALLFVSGMILVARFVI